MHFGAWMLKRIGKPLRDPIENLVIPSTKIEKVLNNEAASFITGVCIPIDGGFSAYSGV